MSSLGVRTLVTAFLATEAPTETVLDLTAEFQELKDVLEDMGLGPKDPWLGLQFVGGEEIPVDIAASNTEGLYRETGVIYLHVVEVARLGPKTSLILRADALRSKFRGRRLGDLVIKSVSPPLTGRGVTLNFEGGYTAALVEVTYEYSFTL